MIRGQRWWLLRVAIPLLAALGVLVWAVGRSGYVVTLENQSGQSIPLLQITRGGETSTFKDIPAGAEVTASTNAGGPFTVEGQLANKTLIRSHFGDLGARAALVLRPDGQLSPRKRKE
jgi:hypothetical protein